MSFNKPPLKRQISVSMLSPFSRHHATCGRDSSVLLKEKRLLGREFERRRRSLLGSDINKNWFKSIDTEISAQSDNDDSASLDSVYDSPLIVHSAKTGHSSLHLDDTNRSKRGLLDVKNHGVYSKSGDARLRKQDDMNVIRPMTVGPTRENMTDDGSLRNAVDESDKTTEKTSNFPICQVDSHHQNQTNHVRPRTTEPLPPIKPSLLSTKKSTENCQYTHDENYFIKSEEILDESQANADAHGLPNDSELASADEGREDEDRVDQPSPSVAPSITRPRLDSYRSVTPLSLCEVMSDIDHNTTDSGYSPVSISISDSDDYDTDIEYDPNFGKEFQPESDLSVCQWVYRQECKKLQIPPQKHVIKGLSTRILSMRNRSLGPNAMPPLCQALKDNLRVERLNLDGTDITDAGIQPIADMLLENITICHLNLANNNLGLKASQAISHVIIATDNLTHLNLSGNKFDNHSSWFLSSGIGSNTSITHLDMSYNEFGEQAGVLLGTGLARNSKLAVLNLSWNKVCGKGAVAIFQALMVNSTLEVLDISWNGLGYDGAVALSKCMKVNKRLADIDVSNNRLDWRCGFLLAEGLTLNSKIQKLKIGYNPLTTAGCMDVLESVATLESTVNLLDCSVTYIHIAGGESRPRNYSLNKLELRGFDFPPTIYTKGITVVGEADLLAATISRRRKFQFIHGGIVTAHDKVGEKPGREVNPMLRIIEYLRLLGLRPLELMKSFDKSSSFELPRKEFIEQIKKIGVKLQPYEIDALANSVSGKGYNKNVINYRKLSLAVREVVQAERERKMREREEWMQIKSYHENILRKGQLDYSQKSTRLAERDTLRAGMIQAASGVFGGSIESLSSPHRSKVQLSMCSPLESSRSIISSPQKRKKRVKKKRDTKGGKAL